MDDFYSEISDIMMCLLSYHHIDHNSQVLFLIGFFPTILVVTSSLVDRHQFYSSVFALFLILISFIYSFFFQLVYQLFTTNLTPDEENVKIVMQMAEEAVCAQDRDPYTAFTNRVKELNYGNSYFFRVWFFLVSI